MWMENAREGRVSGPSGEGRFEVRLDDGETVRAVPGVSLRRRGEAVEEGDAVLLRPRDDGWEIMLRRRFPEGHCAPLLVPSIDPTVEFLLEPGEPKWLHPHLPCIYDWYDDFDEDLPMWRRLASEAGEPVLELACGTGRVVRELARAGHRVTGVDISQPMIDRAAEKMEGEPAEVRDRVEWICGDMSDWWDDRRFPFAFIACNSLHYMGSQSGLEPGDLRRRAVETLFCHVAPGGLGVISNSAPAERRRSPAPTPAPCLPITRRAGINPNTGLFTCEYMGMFVDGETGTTYGGPWRFMEEGQDGRRRFFEFEAPPEDPDELRVPARPEPLTRFETAELMRDAGFVDVEMRSQPDLDPAPHDSRVVVFLGYRPR